MDNEQVIEEGVCTWCKTEERVEFADVYGRPCCVACHAKRCDDCTMAGGEHTDDCTSNEGGVLG